MTLNVYGVGTLTADPQINQVGARETSVCSANLAFNRRFKSGEEWKDEVCFVQVKLWGASADKFAERCKKGTSVSIEGYMTQESWTDKNDVNHKTLVIRVNNFSVCERPASNASTNAKTNSKQTDSAPPKNNKTNSKPVAATKPRKQEPVEELEEDAVPANDEVPF